MPNQYIFLTVKWLYVAISFGFVVWLYLSLRGPGVLRWLRIGACLLAILLPTAFPLSRYMEDNGLLPFVLSFAGTAWLAFMMHAGMAWALFKVFRLGNARFRWFPTGESPELRARARYRRCAAIILIAFLATVAGWINVQYPVVRHVSLPAPAGTAPLRIVLLSDTHLGRLTSPEFLSKVVDLIQPLSPDLVLFAGDILEYDFHPSDIEATTEVLSRLDPHLGVWGVLGNHEFINGRGEISKNWLNQMGIRILVDQWAEIGETPAEKILLIGRNDRSAVRHTGRQRKTLDEILVDAPKDGRLKILLDHQPFNLEEAEKADVYLQGSGHTHNGQLFPFNLVAAAMYENAYGYSVRSQTHYWVTSGVGTWGPRARTTGRPEIISIDLVPRIEPEHSQKTVP